MPQACCSITSSLSPSSRKRHASSEHASRSYPAVQAHAPLAIPKANARCLGSRRATRINCISFRVSVAIASSCVSLERKARCHSIAIRRTPFLPSSAVPASHHRCLPRSMAAALRAGSRVVPSRSTRAAHQRCTSKSHARSARCIASRLMILQATCRGGCRLRCNGCQWHWSGGPR